MALKFLCNTDEDVYEMKIDENFSRGAFSSVCKDLNIVVFSVKLSLCRRCDRVTR